MASRKTTTKSGVLALGGLWLVISGGVVLAPGCYGRNCQGDTITFGAEPGEGEMVDTQTWESNSQAQPWLPFPRQRFYIFDVRALGGRTPELVLPYVAAESNPNSGGNATIGAGDLALLMNATANHVEVKNNTCSDYFLRLVLTVPPVPPVTPVTPDGGSTAVVDLADASVGSDAGRDAGI